MKAPAPGSILAGKYRVERVLGEGGMGVVVAATHVHLDQRVALKFVHAELAKNPEVVARFSREARTAVKIQSEHVARVLDVGALENGVPYMVMEYLEGSDLSDLVRVRGALPGQEAIEYLLQAGEALAEAHVAGIVHRDLKPANLFLTRRADGTPVIKVLDFGISKAAMLDGAQAMTQTSAVLGSPRYMSPEQLRSPRDVDARTDIWALGIILHELLVGEAPFRADTVPTLYVNILSLPPEPLRARRPEAPAGVEAVILRCLEKDPARRYANMGELARALAPFAPERARVSVERVQRIIGGGRVQPTVPEAPHVHGPPAGQPSWAPGSGHGASAHPHAVSQGPQMVSHPGAMPMPLAPMPGGPYAAHYAVPAEPQSSGPNVALIVLLTLVGVMVVGAGGCMLCMCAAAAGSPSHPPMFQELEPPPGDLGPVDAPSALGSSVGCAPSNAGRLGLRWRPVSEPAPCSSVQLRETRTGAASRTGLQGGAPIAGVDSQQRREQPVDEFRAHSSIGQSPRLITGLFLVRTQVGLPLPLPPSRTPSVRKRVRRRAST